MFLLSKVEVKHSGETVGCHKYSSAILECSAYTYSSRARTHLTDMQLSLESAKMDEYTLHVYLAFASKARYAVNS